MMRSWVSVRLDIQPPLTATSGCLRHFSGPFHFLNKVSVLQGASFSAQEHLGTLADPHPHWFSFSLQKGQLLCDETPPFRPDVLPPGWSRVYPPARGLVDIHTQGWGSGARRFRSGAHSSPLALHSPPTLRVYDEVGFPSYSQTQLALRALAAQTCK